MAKNEVTSVMRAGSCAATTLERLTEFGLLSALQEGDALGAPWPAQEPLVLQPQLVSHGHSGYHGHC